GYRVITKNESIQTYNAGWVVNFDELSNGTNDIAFVLSDNAQNLVNTAKVFHILKDVISPTVDQRLTFNQGLWYRSPPSWMTSVDIDFYDSGESLLWNLAYIISADGVQKVVTISERVLSNSYLANWVLSWDLLSEGQNDIWLRFNDRAGNEVTTYSFTFRKDDIDPVIGNTVAVTGGTMSRWYNSAPGWLTSVSVNFSDVGGSHLGASYYGIRQGDDPVVWDRITGNLSVDTFNELWPVSWNLLPNGQSTIDVRVSDNAGNSRNMSEILVIRKDVIVPTYSVLFNPNEDRFVNTWYNAEPEWLSAISIHFEDFGSSNLHSIYYTVTNVSGSTQYPLLRNDPLQAYPWDWAVSWSVLANG
ncbi:MAG: hypothetical protein AABZ14_05635, partial [Candidatus Margulisiibacteriota bacterium]